MGYRAAAVDGSTARYDGLADWYDEVAAPSAELSSESLLDLLYCRDGLCLDLGCGTGLYGPILERAGRTVIGVELSQDQLRHAKHREVVTAGDASKLPFRDRSFDDVFGVHPCFNGPCVESRDDGARVVHPNYRQSGWHLSAPWWSASGIRSAVVSGIEPSRNCSTISFAARCASSASRNHETTRYQPF